MVEVFIPQNNDRVLRFDLDFCLFFICDEIKEWLRNFKVSDIHWITNIEQSGCIFTFEKAEDAILFKLTWF